MYGYACALGVAAQLRRRECRAGGTPGWLLNLRTGNLVLLVPVAQI